MGQGLPLTSQGQPLGHGSLRPLSRTSISRSTVICPCVAPIISRNFCFLGGEDDTHRGQSRSPPLFGDPLPQSRPTAGGLSAGWQWVSSS